MSGRWATGLYDAAALHEIFTVQTPLVSDFCFLYGYPKLSCLAVPAVGEAVFVEAQIPCPLERYDLKVKARKTAPATIEKKGCLAISSCPLYYLH